MVYYDSNICINSDHCYKQKITFWFIEQVMYLVYNIDCIRNLLNELKELSFAYNSDKMVYMLVVNLRLIALFNPQNCRDFFFKE